MFSYEGIEYQGVEFDTRRIKSGQLFVPMLGKRDGHRFIQDAVSKGAKGAMHTRPVQDVPEDFNLHKVTNVLREFQELAKGHRMGFKGKVIALTGSNGKTTVKEMLYAILSQSYQVTKTEGNLNNHLGVPYTLLNASLDDDIWIVEVGTNHPGEIEVLREVILPDYAVITNIGDAHIGNFGSRKNIALEKFSLAKGLEREQVFTNSNCMFSLMAPSIGTGKHDILAQEKERTEFRYKGEIFEIPLFGEYNVENALLAIEVAVSFGMGIPEIKEGLKQFAAQSYRQKWITIDNLKVCLDCYNANPTSLVLAANEFDKSVQDNKLFIVGDLYELGDEEKEIHRKIGQEFSDKNVWFVGKLMKEAYLHSDSGTKRYFATKEEIKEVIPLLAQEELSIFVKASRGMALEKIFE